jgi:membrane-associated phospholipid phosphatase
LAEIDGKLGFAHAVAGLAAVVPGVGWSVLVAAYWLFFPMVIAALVRHGRGGRASAESFQGALFIVYAFGYIGYLVLPAAGPGLAGLWPDLSGGQSLAVGSYEVMRWGSNGADAFPSLHAAISVFLAVLAVRGADRGGRIWLPVAVLVPVAAVLLGYHYVVDVLAGAALGGLAAVSSARLDNSRPYAST